jgi:hypothetical protein
MDNSLKGSSAVHKVDNTKSSEVLFFLALTFNEMLYAFKLFKAAF